MAGIQLDQPDTKLGRTPLMLLAIDGDASLDLIKTMFDKKPPNVNRPDFFGEDALTMAKNANAVDVGAFLIKTGKIERNYYDDDSYAGTRMLAFIGRSLLLDWKK
jgi:hypothetical protein